MYRVAVFVSGGGTNLQTILDQVADGSLPGVEVVQVIASRPGTFAEKRAGKAGIPVQVVPRKQFDDQVLFDQAVLAAVAPARPDLIVLAGWLCFLGPTFVQAYANRIINIHPSLIPAYCGRGYYGLVPHRAVIQDGTRETGATVHFVDTAYDTGPILLQKVIPVLAEDTPETLQQRVMKECEQVILPQAIRLLSEGRVEVQDRTVHVRETVVDP